MSIFLIGPLYSINSGHISALCQEWNSNRNIQLQAFLGQNLEKKKQNKKNQKTFWNNILTSENTPGVSTDAVVNTNNSGKQSGRLHVSRFPAKNHGYNGKEVNFPIIEPLFW